MDKFSWYEAKTVEEALEQVNATASEVLSLKKTEDTAVLKSGGIDLLDLMKEGLVNPSKVVNIRQIPGLDTISYDKRKGLTIGANATIAQLEEDQTIKDQYLALHQAASHVATPQIRNMATLGGNLAQRTRCWYFRSQDHPCFRKGGSTCFARNGENENHAIMKNGSCISIHASSVATALIAFGASVEIMNGKGEKKQVLLDDFFVAPGDDVTRENILKADELITAVILPPTDNKTKSYYIKQGARESYDWALADVAVVANISGSNVKKASVVLGAVAPIPVNSKSGAEALTGKAISEATALAVAEASMESATPLERNAYKVPLCKAIIKRTVLKLA